MTGDMTNRLRNRASPARTWFGGMLGTPSALRVSDSTTMIFVKLVPSMSSAGAMASTVISRMMTTGWLGLPPTLSRRTVTDPGTGATGLTPGATRAAARGARLLGPAGRLPRGDRCRGRRDRLRGHVGRVPGRGRNSRGDSCRARCGRGRRTDDRYGDDDG